VNGPLKHSAFLSFGATQFIFGSTFKNIIIFFIVTSLTSLW